MTELEKTILLTITNLTDLLCEVGKTQTKIGVFISDHFPNSDAQHLLASAKNTEHELLQLEQKAKSLQGLLE